MTTGAKRALLIVFLVAAVSFGYYLTYEKRLSGPDFAYYHTLFRDLYFVPLALGGIWFGLKGALSTSFAITAAYLPFLLMNWHGFSLTDFDRMMEVAVFNSGAAVLGVISDRERAREKALREAENLAAMGTAVSALVHDMRSPVIAIGGFARLIREEADERNGIRRRIDLIIEAADRLEAMAADLLDFARPLRLEVVPANIDETITKSLYLLEGQGEEKRVTIETVLDGALPDLEFDGRRMEQVVTNLVSNAIDASPEGGSVKVTSRIVSNKVTIEVADRGSGVPEEMRTKVFNPFFTTKNKGTGLGLAIVAKIVRAHKGTVEIRDRSGGGTVFRVTLPRSP
jgi:two-component system, NtrC family, sensor histidine kinase HydH